jgi:hypothetical protein
VHPAFAKTSVGIRGDLIGPLIARFIALSPRFRGDERRMTIRRDLLRLDVGRLDHRPPFLDFGLL